MAHHYDNPSFDSFDTFDLDEADIRDLIRITPLTTDGEGHRNGYDAEELFDFEVIDLVGGFR